MFYLHLCLCESVKSPGTGVIDRCELPVGARNWGGGGLGSSGGSCGPMKEKPLP